MLFTVILGLISASVLGIALAIGLLAVQNPALVSLNFLTFRMDRVALSVLVPGAALLGAALAVVLGIGWKLGQRAVLSSLEA